jgi:hypothetical protein
MEEMWKKIRISPPHSHINDFFLHTTGIRVKSGKTPFKNPPGGGYWEGDQDIK